MAISKTKYAERCDSVLLSELRALFQPGMEVDPVHAEDDIREEPSERARHALDLADLLETVRDRGAVDQVDEADADAERFSGGSITDVWPHGST